MTFFRTQDIFQLGILAAGSSETWSLTLRSDEAPRKVTEIIRIGILYLANKLIMLDNGNINLVELFTEHVVCQTLW